MRTHPASEHGSIGLPDHGVKLQGKCGQATNVAVNRSLEVETSGSARMAPRLHRACGLSTRSDDMVQEPLAVYGREDVSQESNEVQTRTSHHLPRVKYHILVGRLLLPSMIMLP
jgi:hypothetical protein